MRIVTTASPTAPTTEFPLETRTSPALWRYVLAQGWPTPAYLEEQADGWREVSLGRGRPSGSTRSRAALLARGVRSGDAVAVVSLGPASSGSCSTGRSCRSAPSSSASIRRTPRASARTSSATPRPCSRSSRTTSSARSSRRSSDELPQLREVIGFDELAGVRARGRADGVEPDAGRARTTSRRSSTRPARPARRRAAC